MYSIDEMVEICVKGDVVKPGNAEYLRRNLEEFMSYDMPAIVKKVQQLEAKEKWSEKLISLIHEANNCSIDGEVLQADWDNILLFVGDICKQPE